ncbi:hypothetical protein [Roseovarius aestuariivivens]|uniref:hypothetical protein n=1 Tax=Roseovarius aestuariivivens TaxID=1888910 RepID=UPI001080D7A5|nr:hypothetical protein [Roseovarius aestuariivivens]
MPSYRMPLIFALIGAFAGAVGYGLSTLAGRDLGASFLTIVLAGSIGGMIGGWLRQRREK